MKKKILLSLFLALMMVFEIAYTPLNTHAVYSDEGSDSDVPEYIELAPVVNRNLRVQVSNGWETSLVFYDSTVGGGNTPLTSIDWDASNSGYGDGETRIIKVQINYRNSNTITSYAPGDLKFSIPNLVYGTVYSNNTGLGDLFGNYEAQWSSSVVVGANDSTHVGYDWNFITAESPSTEQETYEFTNAITFEKDTNFEGSIMIEYTITPLAELEEKNHLLSIEEFEDSCTHNFSKSLQSALKDTTDSDNILSSSNVINLSYTRVYSHEWVRRDFEFTKTAEKIKSYDGLPSNAEDYTWVKYVFTVEGDPDTSYPYIGLIDDTKDFGTNSSQIQDTFPSDCIVYDAGGNKLVPQSGSNYVVNGFTDFQNTYTNVYRKWLFVGYPKDRYNDALGNLNVTNYADLYAYYEDGSDFEFCKTASVSINLNDFLFTYSGNLYGITKTITSPYLNSTSRKMRYQDILADGTYNETGWAAFVTAKYTGTSMTVKIGDDLLYALNSSNDYVRLTDDEYYFTEVEFPALNNGNEVAIPADKYDCELWVRYSGSSSYIKYEDFKTVSSKKTWKFSRGDGVVGYYFLVKDMQESISSGYFYTKLNFIKDDIATSGSLYNFNYLQVYFNDGSGNLILQNEPDESSYANSFTKDNIAEYDLNTYGVYLQRGRSNALWSYYDTSLKTSMGAYKKFNSSVVQDEVNKEFTGSARVGVTLLPVVYYDSAYNEYYREKPEEMLYGLEVYDLLPRGMEMTSTASEIVDSIIIGEIDYAATSSTKFLDKDFNVMLFSTVRDIIKNNTSVSIVENWNGTGRTRVGIVSDFSENPMYVARTNSAGSSKKISVNYSFDYNVSYDAYLEYGGSYMNYAYAGFTSQPSSANKVLDTVCEDSGVFDVEASDINGNGDTVEELSYASDSVVISSVVSSYQDVQTTVQTDISNYSTGTVKASPETEYSYKLRARTGSAPVTNLVLIDNLEEAYGTNLHWKGEFIGVDTSYAEGRTYRVYKPDSASADPEGYITQNISVRVYYSENANEGNLYETEEVTLTGSEGSQITQIVRALDTNGNPIRNTGWVEYNSSVDSSKVKSLAFEFLDANTGEVAIIPSDDMVYVEILMKAPSSSEAYSGMGMKYAYNSCFTQWNALDEFNNAVDFITGINSNIVKVGLDISEITISGSKSWEGDTEFSRPGSVTVKLLQNGSEYRSTTATYDGNWKYSFENVPLYDSNGIEYTYVVEEVPKAGYNVEYSNGLDRVSVPTSGYYDIINIKAPVPLVFTKKDFFTGKPISGVQFGLYRLECSESHTHSKPGSGSCWSEVSSGVSDANGVVTLNGLLFNEVYGVVEEVPVGYDLPNSLYWKVVYSEADGAVWSTVCDESELKEFNLKYYWLGYKPNAKISSDGYTELSNIRSLRSVAAMKRIKAEDINFDNGNPTFIFKLSGVDVTGVSRTYYRQVTFTEEYVNGHTYAEGYTLTGVSFENIVPGHYILSEEEVSRYSFEDISNVVNGVINGETVEFDLSANTYGVAMFTNKVYENQWFSHNGIVVNSVVHDSIIADEGGTPK